MGTRALPDDALERFLLRKRRARPIAERPPLGGLLADTLDLTARLIPCEAASLLLDDPSRRGKRAQLTFIAEFGPTPTLGTQVGVREGIAGESYRTGNTLRLAGADLRSEDGERTRSIIATPIIFEKKVCGVLELVNRRGRGSKGAFSTRDEELVKLVARTLSSAILNAVDILKQSRLALRDDLTGLRNVRGLDEQLDRMIQRTLSTSDCALLWLDVDGLKRINDRHGHAAGSEALVRTARATQKLAPESELVFRFGGDELVVLCPGHNLEEALTLGNSLRAEIREATRGPLAFGGHLPALSVSVGAASLRASLRSGTSKALSARLLTAGDRALYRAKRAGRNRVAAATRRDDPLETGRSRRKRRP